MRRGAFVALFGALTLLGPGAGVATNSVTLQVVNTAGTEDPVEDIGRTFVVQGQADAPTRLYVKYRRSGGAPCAPSAASDSGEGIDPYGEYVDGAFRLTTARVWTESGSFMFCMWLANYSYEVAPSFSRVVAFRIPNGSVSLATSPTVLRPRVPGTITVSGTSEAPRTLYVKYRPMGGAPCAPSPSSDSGGYFGDLGGSVDGSFSEREAATFDRAGSYLFCLWLREHSGDVEPTGGTPVSFTVSVRTPVRCRIPSVVGQRLVRARTKIARANCSVGRVIFQRSKRPRNRVIGQYPRSGTFARGFRVHLFVSRGAR